MNDQIPTPPRRPRPASQGRQHRMSAAPSRESRFIGYVVLGFGVIAVITVLILAFSGKESGPRTPDTAPAVSNIPVVQERPNPNAKNIMAELGSALPKPVAPAAPLPGQAFKRQKDIPVEGIAGAWQAMIGQYTAVVQMDGKVYQIILASADPNAERIYSSGTYEVVDDIITFTPQTHWPPPNPGGNKFVSYSMLTRASFSLTMAFHKGRMYWQNAPATETRIYTTLKSPLFMTEDVNYVVWQKVSG